MSFTELGFFMVAGWTTFGLVLALLMGRRGHDSFSWLLIGALLGPLSIPLAIDARRHDEDRRPLLVGRSRGHHLGPVDVLVGFDGSPECLGAASSALSLLGPRVGRVTLAAVVPYDGGRDNERQAREALDRLLFLADVPVRREILHGRPADALVERATSDGYQLLVVGTRGTGASRALLGSTAAVLARTARIPVLMGGAVNGGDRAVGESGGIVGECHLGVVV